MAIHYYTTSGTYDAVGNLIRQNGATTSTVCDQALCTAYAATAYGTSAPKPEKPKKKVKPVAKIGDPWYRRFDRKSRRK